MEQKPRVTEQSSSNQQKTTGQPAQQLIEMQDDPVGLKLDEIQQ